MSAPLALAAALLAVGARPTAAFQEPHNARHELHQTDMGLLLIAAVLILVAISGCVFYTEHCLRAFTPSPFKRRRPASFQYAENDKEAGIKKALSPSASSMRSKMSESASQNSG